MGRALKITIFFSLVCLFLGFYLGQNAGAGTTSAPGSQDDPLVSKSWVTSYVKQEIGSSEAISESPAAPARAPSYQVVELRSGQKVLLGGGTEMVLRTGDAISMEGDGGGLSNLTEGNNILQGQPIPRDHLLLSPRRDGRGLEARSNVIVLIRGDYEVTN